MFYSFYYAISTAEVILCQLTCANDHELQCAKGFGSQVDIPATFARKSYELITDKWVI